MIWYDMMVLTKENILNFNLTLTCAQKQSDIDIALHERKHWKKNQIKPGVLFCKKKTVYGYSSTALLNITKYSENQTTKTWLYLLVISPISRWQHEMVIWPCKMPVSKSVCNEVHRRLALTYTHANVLLYFGLQRQLGGCQREFSRRRISQIWQQAQNAPPPNSGNVSGTVLNQTAALKHIFVISNVKTFIINCC